MSITISEHKIPLKEQVIELYEQNKWSSAHKPSELYKALQNSHSVITAWNGEQLIGLGNAISDGYLVVYYPHLLVLPQYQGKGIGKLIMDKFQEKYGHLHQQILVSDANAIDFYQKCGFEKAGTCSPMWIYSGTDHD